MEKECEGFFFSNQWYIQCFTHLRYINWMLSSALTVEFTKEEREASPFSVTVASGHVEERTDPRQLKSSPAKGSKVPPQGIYCPPAATKHQWPCGLLCFCHWLEVTPAGFNRHEVQAEMSSQG